MIRFSSSTPHHASSPPTLYFKQTQEITAEGSDKIKHDSRPTRNSQKIHTLVVFPAPPPHVMLRYHVALAFKKKKKKERAACELPVFQHNSERGREKSAQRH